MATRKKCDTGMCESIPSKNEDSTSVTSRARDESSTVTEDFNFSPPLAIRPDEEFRLAIEFCDRCRWLHRANWTCTELFLTFPPPSDSASTNGLSSITLIPHNKLETAGRWRIWLFHAKKFPQGYALVYDRKIEGGFGEMKVLKQKIRNLIDPERNLGHSDQGQISKGGQF